MKYEVIARRYRPLKFEEVVGQESVAQTLRGGILQGRLAHAYLFAGPRGVGKTSMARIFAKAINCPVAADRDGPREKWAVSCDECPTCHAIHSGQDLDVIEMDGASNRGIEDVRSLIEGVNRPASRSPYKVYLIDEVHMLTREAFNALLKTLEEPPSHVKFIFATTEAHKIPDTVLSRCQRFDFQPIREEDIVRRLDQICAAEGRECEDGLLLRIARYSKGGLRDSQTLLDQLMTFAADVLTVAELDRLTGRVDAASVDAIYAGLVGRQSAAVLDAVRGCLHRGADPAILLEQVIETYHEALVAAVAAESPASGAGSEATAPMPTVDVAIGSLQVLVETATRLRTSAYPAVAVEIALLRLARLEDPRALDRAIARLEGVERQHRGGPPVGPRSAPPADRGMGAPATVPRPAAASEPGPGPAAVAPSAPTAAPAPAVAPPPADPAAPPSRPMASSESAQSGVATAVASPELAAPAGPPAEALGTAACDRDRLRQLWEQILIEARKKHPGMGSFLGESRLDLAQNGGGADSFTLRFADEFHLRQMKKEARITALQAIVRDVTAEPWRVRIEKDRAPPPTAVEPPQAAPAAEGPPPAAVEPPQAVPAAEAPSPAAPAAPVATPPPAAPPPAAPPPSAAPAAPVATPPPAAPEAAPRPAAPPQAGQVPPPTPQATSEAAPQADSGPAAGAPAVRLKDDPIVKKAKELFNGRLV